jgi:outer membrane lipoprotein carrier protein
MKLTQTSIMKIKQFLPCLRSQAHCAKATYVGIILGIGFISASNICFAANTTANTAITTLNQKFQAIKTLSANFKQTVYASDGSQLQTSSGTFQIKRPGMFKWLVTKPFKQDLITNGKFLWIYEPGLQQVTVRKLSKNLAHTPLLLLTSNKVEIQNQFTVKQLNNPQIAGSVYQLTPLDKGQQFKQVNVQFVNGQLRALQMLNKLNQRTEIIFSKQQMNKPISSTSFDFKIPKQTDVINLTKQQQ